MILLLLSFIKLGNWDLVGNNTPVFFIRDPSKFPDFIHTQKRNPQTNLKDPDMFWDFLSLVPESLHQVTILFSDRGTPDGYRFMHGYGSHTFKIVDDNGSFKYVKFHIKSCKGFKTLTEEQALKLLSEDPDYSTRDLFNAISKGDLPTWDVCLQIMDPKDAQTYQWDILDVTKVWPHKDYPLIKIGKITLDRNPENYFAETEQSAFSPSHTVPGIEPSNDKMLQGRLFSYPDTHRHRLGVNYLQIPVNRPINSKVANYHRDGYMNVDDNFGSLPNYEPNSFGGPQQAGPSVAITNHPLNDSEHITTIRKLTPSSDIDFIQPGNLYRLQSPESKAHLVNNVVKHLKNAKKFIQERQLGHFKKADKEYGQRIEKGLMTATIKI